MLIWDREKIRYEYYVNNVLTDRRGLTWYTVIADHTEIRNYLEAVSGFNMLLFSGISYIVLCGNFIYYCNIAFNASSANVGIPLDACQYVCKLKTKIPVHFVFIHTASNISTDGTQEIAAAQVGVAPVWTGDAVLRFDFPFGMYTDASKVDSTHLKCIFFSGIGIL